MTTRELECEYCDSRAVGQVHLQWSFVDFMAFQVCEKHIDPVVRNWLDVKVDGHPLVDAWFTRYWE